MMIFRPSLIMLALFTAGCAAVDPSSSAAGKLPDAAGQALASDGANMPLTIAPVQAGMASGAPPMRGAATTSAPRIFPGSDQLVKTDVAPKVDPVLAQGDRVSLNFENVTVGSLAAALLGDLLQVSYTVDAGGDTVVSLRTRKPLPRRQVLDVLDTVLLPHDLAIVRDAAGVYHVTKRSVTVGTRPLASASRVKDLTGAGTVIVPLEHIGASEMAKILGPLAPRESIVYVDGLRNLLVLQGSKAQLAGWLEMVDAFDVDYLSGMSLGVFPLEYANVSVVYDTLQTMLSPDHALTGQSSGAVAGAAGGGGNAASSAGTRPVMSPSGAPVTAGPLNGLVRLFPIERLNALVVVTPRSQILSQVETWIRRLDQPTDALEAGLFVYPVQNGSAARMAELLNGLFGQAAAGARAGVAAGSAPTQFGQSSGFGSFGGGFGGASSGGGRSGVSLGSAGAFGGANAGLGSGVGGNMGLGVAGAGALGGSAVTTTVSELEGNIRVVADESRNALLIRAPRTEYRRIERALRELDKSPTQVLIEASIVEVTLTGDLRYGVEWAIQNGLGGGRTGNALLNMNTSGGIGAQQPGFSYSIVNNAGVVKATLNALAQKSQLRVLSNPSILVLDNHNATIQVGKQQPVRTGGATVVNGAVISESVTYRDTGVMLSVTPSVNSGGLITLSIAQQVTDVGEIDSATTQRAFLTRQIQSRVAVRSGETIVLGGMIRENESSGRGGVPLLSEIPVVGALFSTTTEGKERTELIVLLTPRALEGDDQVRAASIEMRQRIRSLGLQPLRDAMPGMARESTAGQ